MTMPNVDLTLEIRSTDGSCTEFFQDQEDSVNDTLRSLASPRLFAQPLLVLASPGSVSMIPCRTIDMVLAHTSVAVLPQWPGDLADVVEVPAHCSEDSHEPDARGRNSENGADISTTLMHFYTAGGWFITLELTRTARLTVPDQRVLLAHIFELPAFPFRLAAGGIGFINPSQVIRATGQPPKPDHVSRWPGLMLIPKTALPVHLLRWTPRLRRDANDRVPAV